MPKIRKTAQLILFVILLTSCKNISTPAGLTNSEIVSITAATAAESSETEPPAPLPPGLNSRAVYVYDLNNDVCVYKQNEDERLPPASILKIMTCLLTLEKVPDLSQKVLVPKSVFDEFTDDDPYSNTYNAADAGIQPGQTNLTYTDVLYAMMLASGCEASSILAYNVGDGDMDAFFDEMNKKASAIGCKNTHFTNAHGLYDSNNLTSAYDMFVITKYAIDNYPLFSEICSKTVYVMPANSKYPNGYKIKTANKLMRDDEDNPHYLPYVSGVKSGSINEYFDENGERFDGFNTLVSIAEKDGAKYMVVTLGSPYYDYSDGEGKRAYLNYDDHFALYLWLFGAYADYANG